MLRSAANLLSRLAQRTPLARRLPGAEELPAPEAFCPRSGYARLHIFARTSASHGEYMTGSLGEYGKVEVGDSADASDLKKAIIVELKLDAAPHCVRLLREVAGGGAPVPLDAFRALAEQGMHAGTSVLLELLLPLSRPRCASLRGCWAGSAQSLPT